MVQSQLSAYSGSDPIWGFVALVGSELFTGEAAVGLDPRVRLFAVEGKIYFAEREDDAPVATRLVSCGAISAMQLARGAVQAGGHDSLARLFQRDVTIDRDAVELTVATATEGLLASIAHNPVGMPEVFPLRYHSAGLHHWLRGAPPVVAADEIPAADEVSAENEAVADETPVFEAPVVDAPVLEAPVLEAPVLEAPAAELPMLDRFPAPKVATEPTAPEWLRVDDEPAWAVPTEAAELPKISELVVLAAPVVEPEVAAPEAAPDEVVPAELPSPTVEPVVEPVVETVVETVVEPVVEPAVATTVEPVAMPPVVVSITAAELPQLASLSSFQIQPTPVDVLEPQSLERQPFEPVTPTNSAMPIASAPAVDTPSLPKLAAGPMSVKDLKEDLKRAAVASTEPWSSTSNNMAAVQIWEMVDDLFEDPKEDARVGGGASDERRSWRHKKT